MLIADEIQNEIEGGIYSEGDRLPSEALLCRRFYCNRYTIRQAMDRLKNIQLIHVKQGAGYFISERPLDVRYTITPSTRFSKMIESAGHVPSALVISKELCLPSKKVQETLHLPKNREVFRFEILRFADKTPLAWNETWLPANAFPELEKYMTSFSSLYGILQKQYDVEPQRMFSTFAATIPSTSEASYLQIPLITPLLQIESIVSDEKKGRIEYTKAKYRGDLCQVTSTL